MKINVLLVINILGLIGALTWLCLKPDWEPIVTVFGLIGTLLAQKAVSVRRKGKIKMSQKGGKNSKNYQAGGNINLKLK